jgi:hypothetical protein
VARESSRVASERFGMASESFGMAFMRKKTTELSAAPDPAHSFLPDVGKSRLAPVMMCDSLKLLRGEGHV